jgi:hypothetical protein
MCAWLRVPARRALEDDMRRVIVMTMLAAGAMTALPSFPAQAQYAICMPVRGCLPTTQASYNACFQLALQRGWTWSDNKWEVGGRSLNWFIYQCLAGKIPRYVN